jgi:hypothetical protein
MLRFCSRVGFNPPYFYNRSLKNRLYRIKAPALVIWGLQARFVRPLFAKTVAGAPFCRDEQSHCLSSQK